jgi:hypothetical protein
VAGSTGRHSIFFSNKYIVLRRPVEPAAKSCRSPEKDAREKNHGLSLITRIFVDGDIAYG